MSSLDSNVTVFLKDESIVMPADSGKALMNYLTSENGSSHVMITDVNGIQTVVNKFDIRKVSVNKQNNRYKTAKELGMPDLLTEPAIRVYEHRA